MVGSTLKRVRDIVRAEIDDVLTRIEDPHKMVNQMVRDMEVAYDDAVVEVSRTVAGQRILERKVAEVQDEAAHLERQAEQAVSTNDEAAARRLLERKVAVDTVAATLRQAHAEATATAETLKARLADLKSKLDSAHTRGGGLAIRKAMAQRRPEQDVDTHLKTQPFTDFERYVRDVEREEITAEVYRDIVGAPKDDLERESRDRRVADELARIKTRLSGQNEA